MCRQRRKKEEVKSSQRLREHETWEQESKRWRHRSDREQWLNFNLCQSPFLPSCLSAYPSVCLWTEIVLSFLHVLHVWRNTDTSAASLCSCRGTNVNTLSDSFSLTLSFVPSSKRQRCPLHKFHAPSDTWDSCGIPRQKRTQRDAQTWNLH